MIVVQGVVKEVGDNEEGMPEITLDTDTGPFVCDKLGILAVKALAGHLGGEVMIIFDEKRSSVWSLEWMGVIE